MTMTQILSDVGLIVTNAITWVGQYVTVITDNPLILMFVIVSFVGLGVGLISRMLHL